MQLARLIGPDLLALAEENPAEVAELVDEIHPEDVAAIVAELEDEQARSLLTALPTDYAAQVLSRLDDERQGHLAEILGARFVAAIATEMPADDRADFFSVLPDSVGDPAFEELERVAPQAAEEVEEIQSFAEKSAGRWMTTDYIAVDSTLRLGVAIEEIRAKAADAETVETIYVTDQPGHLVGTLSLRQLLLSKPDELVNEVMHGNPISVPSDMDQEEVAKLIAKYDLHTLPVVDPQGSLLGVITSDDVLDVIREETAEDMEKMGGMEALDAPYLKIAFGRMVKKRASWLAALFLGEMLTATAMAYFQDEIARAVVLAMFVPLIISSGGNSGSQASTLVIRAMALDEVKLKDVWRVVRRELAAGLVLGTVLGTIGFFRIVVWQTFSPLYGQHYMLVAITVFGSLVGVVTFGTLAGAFLPFTLRKLGFDPASASAPFVATLVDVTGLVIYFTMASIVLHGTLL
jgi:magnesium transporter